MISKSYSGDITLSVWKTGNKGTYKYKISEAETEKSYMAKVSALEEWRGVSKGPSCRILERHKALKNTRLENDTNNCIIIRGKRRLSSHVYEIFLGLNCSHRMWQFLHGWDSFYQKECKPRDSSLTWNFCVNSNNNDKRCFSR